MIDLRSTTWGDVCELKYGRGLRGYKDAEGAVPVYGTNGPIGWCDEPLSKIPSVIVGRKGAYRGVHYSHQPFYVIDTAFFLVPSAQLDTKWAYYNLLTVDINGMDSGSAIPSTSRDDFYRLPLSLPSLTEQKAITSVLGALDDKIENNRRMNETLEDMARAIFKSWFVDFDPVHAKAAGKDPAHMGADTAALFPSSFGDDGLPLGWNLSAIEEHGDVITGKTPSTKRAEYFGDKYLFIKIPNMNSVWVTDTEISLSEAGHQAQYKKLLPTGSVVVSCIASPGAVAIVSKPSHTNQQINAVVPTKECSTGWLYCALVNLRTEIIGMASGGSVTPNLNKGDFSRIKIIDPSKPIMVSFDRITAHLFDKILSNDKENQLLAELRDTLLPKLMSGEIRVADAEREVEAAV
jgi:type I restriction enzyme, S subunit